ncbi:hypothetical protein VTK26DRAFT_3312 [Humicola hyalothermophila]
MTPGYPNRDSRGPCFPFIIGEKTRGAAHRHAVPPSSGPIWLWLIESRNTAFHWGSCRILHTYDSDLTCFGRGPHCLSGTCWFRTGRWASTPLGRMIFMGSGGEERKLFVQFLGRFWTILEKEGARRYCWTDGQVTGRWTWLALGLGWRRKEITVWLVVSSIGVCRYECLFYLGPCFVFFFFLWAALIPPGENNVFVITCRACGIRTGRGMGLR